MRTYEKRTYRYAADKPKNCKFCHCWDQRNRECMIGKERCYYILPEKKKTFTSPCTNCPYAVPNPCIGFCMLVILGKEDPDEKFS